MQSERRLNEPVLNKHAGLNSPCDPADQGSAEVHACHTLSFLCSRTRPFILHGIQNLHPLYLMLIVRDLI